MFTLTYQMSLTWNTGSIRMSLTNLHDCEEQSISYKQKPNETFSWSAFQRVSGVSASRIHALLYL